LRNYRESPLDEVYFDGKIYFIGENQGGAHEVQHGREHGLLGYHGQRESRGRKTSRYRGTGAMFVDPLKFERTRGWPEHSGTLGGRDDLYQKSRER